MPAALVAGIAVALWWPARAGADSASVGRRPTSAPASGSALHDEVRAAAVQRLTAVEHTIDLLAQREKDCRARLRARVRAYARRERAGLVRLWFDGSDRFATLARRAAVSRVLAADLRELQLIGSERDAALVERDRLRREAVAPVPDGPPPGSLVRPVAGAGLLSGFGVHRDPVSGAEVEQRGVRLAVRPGEAVRAPQAGRVRWAGRLAGAGAVVVEHAGGPVAALVGVATPLGVTTGQAVARGQVVGHTAGDSLYLEVRLDTGTFGQPVDPAPLLGP